MLLQELMRRRSALADAERAVADYLLVQRDKIAKMSARQIAREVHAAPSTVVRFCQRFGFAGYDDFRAEFLSELRYITSHFEDIDPNYPFSFGERRANAAFYCAPHALPSAPCSRCSPTPERPSSCRGIIKGMNGLDTSYKNPYLTRRREPARRRVSLGSRSCNSNDIGFNQAFATMLLERGHHDQISVYG